MWIKDPSTHKKSVSLTILVASCVLMMAGGIYGFFKDAKSTDLISEFFFAAVALYFGRRSVSFRGKSIQLDGQGAAPEKADK